MANVHDVAAYILRSRGEMTTWKLQKLLYYSQAWHLAWLEAPLFKARIEAWANGPVVPEIYREHRRQFSVGSWPDGDASKISGASKKVIDNVLGSYGGISGRNLSVLTHNEAPWREARKGLAPTAPSQAQITPAAMQEFYAALDADRDAVAVTEVDWEAFGVS